MNKILPAILAIIVLFGACKKNEWVNPYDDPTLQPPPDSSEIVDLDVANFDGLHHFLFKPTCANSGCHDGTFEPDFRTIESSYNTMVYQPVIKNDSLGSFTFRVLPGDADNSMLLHRMVVDIDGQSGWMPLTAYYDPTDAYNDVRQQYIQHIRDWINNGALDMFGNAPTPGNVPPVLAGALAYGDAGPVQLEREPGNGAILIPDSLGQVELYIAVNDLETASGDLTYNKIKIASFMDGYDGVAEQPLALVPPIYEEGYLGDTVMYDRKIVLNPANYPTGFHFFFRIYVQDDQPVVTEVPNDNSANYIKEYASFIVQ